MSEQLIKLYANTWAKNTSSVGFGGVASGSNATIDQQVLIFERCIRRGSL